MTAIVRLYRPSDFAGRLICWRLESDYSHATIELDGLIYSATFPHIVAVAENDPSFGMPPRQGLALEVRLSDDEAARALAYCRSMVGSDYDVLAMLGWAFRIERMQRPGHVYCFEYVADALAAAGVFQQSKRLITGEQLLNDLYRAGRIAEPPAGTARIAWAQRRPVTVRAPKVTT